MKIDPIQRQPKARVFLASALALALLLALSLLLSRLEASAQPLAEVAADLQVDKQVDKIQADPGETLYYTITVENPNGTSVEAWMTDTLPAETTFVAGNAPLGTLVHADGVLTWSHTMAAFQAIPITFTAEITSGTVFYLQVENTVQFTGTGQLVTDSVTTEVVGNIGNLDNELTFKQGAVDTAEPGDRVTYTIRLNNDDPDPVPNAQFTDALPTGLVLVDGPHALAGNAGHKDGVITYSHTIAGLSFDEVTFSVRVTDLAPDGPLTNTVEMVVPGQTLTRTATFTVQRRYGQLEATKSVYPSSARPGESLTYTIQLSNTGDGDLGTLWLTDTLPSEVSLVTSTLTATRGIFGVAGNVITWTNAMDPGGTLLLPQDRVTLAFAVQIKEGVSNNPTFTNTAQITGDGGLVEARVSAQALTNFNIFLPLMVGNWPPTPLIQPITEVVNHAYTVSWNPVRAAVDQYVLQRSLTTDFGDVDSWTTDETSQLITSIYCTYHYRARVDGPWGEGPWSPTQTAPPAPPELTLNNIPAPDANNAYTVSWSPSAVPVDRYVLQESTDPNFGTISQEWLISGGVTTKHIEKGSSGGGTYYYRVRADDDDCWGQGSWSETRSVVVHIRYDFNTSCPEWAVREHTGYDGPDGTDWFSSGCQDGKLEIWVNDRWEHVIASPLVPSPDRPFEIQTSIYFQDRSWSSGYALVFGILEPQVVRYYRINVVYLSDGMMQFQVKRCEDDYCGQGEVLTEGVPGAGAGGYIQVSKSILNGQEWNAWRVRRDGDQILIYANDNLILDISDDVYTGVGYFGLMVSTWEFKPASILVDYYNVIPLQ